MQYFFKKLGYTEREEGFSIEAYKGGVSAFWEKRCKIYFGNRPKKLSVGDILIYEISSCKKEQKHAVIGAFECISEMKPAEDGIGAHTRDEEKGKWRWYIDAENLTPKFAAEMKRRLEKEPPLLNLKCEWEKLNLKCEWKKLGGGRLPYYGAGWAYVPADKADKAKEIIEKIERIDGELPCR